MAYEKPRFRATLSETSEEITFMTNFAQAPFAPVAQQTEEVRGSFIIKVYQHLALAVGLFVAFEVVMFQTGLARRLADFISGGRMGWILLLGGFMVVQQIAGMSAHNLANQNLQYMGLFGMVAAQGTIFAPYLYLIFENQGGSPVWSAAVVTAIGFAGLTFVGFITRKDLTFMRPLIMWGSFCALGLIVLALIFQFDLGLWFSLAMVALAGASILYQTQNIIRRYPATAYVGAAVGLFGSLMTMFWYILRIFSRR